MRRRDLALLSRKAATPVPALGPALDKLLNEGRRFTAQDKRREVYRSAEERIADREEADEPRSVGSVEAEQCEADGADDSRLDRGEHPECECIATE